MLLFGVLGPWDGLTQVIFTDLVVFLKGIEHATPQDWRNNPSILVRRVADIIANQRPLATLPTGRLRGQVVFGGLVGQRFEDVQSWFFRDFSMCTFWRQLVRIIGIVISWDYLSWAVILCLTLRWFTKANNSKWVRWASRMPNSLPKHFGFRE
jgi:hypothetical protein